MMTMRRCVHCQAYTPVENGKCTVCGNINKGVELNIQAMRDGASCADPYRVKGNGKDIYLYDDRWDDNVFYYRQDKAMRNPMGQTRYSDPIYGVTDWNGMSALVDGRIDNASFGGIAERTVIDDPPYGTRIRYTSDSDRILSLNRRRGWSLGPCPGCGGRTGHVSRYDDGGYSVWCEDCGYETGSDYRKPDYAVDEWNSGGR